MNHSSRHRLVALLVAVAVGGGLYWYAGYAVLAGATGLIWGSALAVTLRIGRRYPAHATGMAWKDKRWTGISVALVAFAAGIGVNTLFSLPLELRITLLCLVGGTGWWGYVTSTMAELERPESSSNTPPQTTETGPAMTDND
jgi:hypothetical protein